MKIAIGRKIGMTRVYDEDGRSFAVTKIQDVSCKVAGVRTKEKDGYVAVVLTAHKMAGKGERAIKTFEFPETSVKKYKTGDKVEFSQFKKDEVVTVEGVGKGKGFAGTIKRHSFAMGPVSHGSKNVRKPGSIGGGYPQRVVKGRKMAGRMGGKNVTVKNLVIADLDADTLLITGSIPGPYHSLVKIYGKGEKAEETVDFAAEEERIAQEKMLEADKEAKDEKTDVTTGEVKIEEVAKETEEN